jgi:hypothetical protein
MPCTTKGREIVASLATFKSTRQIFAVTQRCATEGRVFASLIVVVIVPNKDLAVNLDLDISCPLKAN